MARTRGRRLTRQLLTLFGVFAALPLGAFFYLMQLGPETTTILGPVARFSQAALTASAFAFVLGSILAASLVKSRFEALRGIEDATRRLMRGDYSRRLKVDEKSELQPLMSSFNEMTDHIEAAFRSSQSVADIDQLILSSADLETVLRKVLLTARMRTVEITLILRRDMASKALATFRLEGRRLKEEPIGLLEISDDSLRDVDGYHRIAHRVCGSDIQTCLPVESDGKITGVLVTVATAPLKVFEHKQLEDLAGRLSVAITNIKRSEVLYQKAHFDDLTGLINRHAFEDRLREQISRSWRGEQGALLFIDLDGFKKVNDTEGHKAGDRLLIEISARLKASLREVDTIARLGGDEFAIIVPGCEDEKSIADLCERLIDSLVKPLVVDRIEHTVGASIGIAMFPNDGQSVDELVMKADSAMYRAKETGRARFEFFEDSLNEANRHRVLVESRLRRAIKRDDLYFKFQPKLRLSDNSIDSAEALLRWTDSELGIVSPSTFVAIAEETNLVHEFTSIQVSAVGDLLAQADACGVKIEHIAINTSAKQLVTDGYAISLLSMLDQRSLPHHNIEVEVTETVFASDTQAAVRELEILQAAGIRIALDDFGTGFSSLNMLRELPLDVVKIDRSFVTELENSDQARNLFQHLVSIATTLGKEVVAEGVETEVQLHHLNQAKCHYVQGYLISRAKPPEEFLKLVAEWQSGESNNSLQLMT